MDWFMIALGVVGIAAAVITRYEMWYGFALGAACIIIGVTCLVLGTGHIIAGLL